MNKGYIAILAVALLLGCSKKEGDDANVSAAKDPSTGDAAAAPGKETLPGASAVRKDLESKQYSQAVQGLKAISSFAREGQMYAEYRMLSAEVGNALAEASATDQNAARALADYRAFAYGMR